MAQQALLLLLRREQEFVFIFQTNVLNIFLSQQQQCYVFCLVLGDPMYCCGDGDSFDNVLNKEQWEAAVVVGSKRSFSLSVRCVGSLPSPRTTTKHKIETIGFLF